MSISRMAALPWLIWFMSLGASAPCFAGTESASIEISEVKGGYELTVPVSRLVMSLPGSSLVQNPDHPGHATNGPRYFYFEDHAQGLVLSGWFEPEQGFRGMQQFWQGETRAWKKAGLPEPRDVVFRKVGKWDAVAYSIPIPGANNAHLRAHWLQAGTWIDIHLSLTSKMPDAENRAKLETMLKAIQVRQKSP